MKLYNILNIILRNKEKLISKKGLFTKLTLMNIKSVFNGELLDYLEFTKKEEEIFIKEFINNDLSFNNNTPNFIIRNHDCIISSIKKDINTINYVEYFTSEIIQVVLSEAKRQKYIIDENSPHFMKFDIDIIMNSIKNDVNSINTLFMNVLSTSELNQIVNYLIESGYKLENTSLGILKGNYKLSQSSLNLDIETSRYINWDNLSTEEQQNLINILIENSYVLKDNSHFFLKSNFKFVFLSLKTNLTAADHINWESFNEKEISILIDLLIEKQYFIHKESPIFLRNNKKLSSHSLKLNPHSVFYINADIKDDTDIYKQALLSSVFRAENLKCDKLSHMMIDHETFDYFFENLIANSENNIANSRRKIILNNLLTSKPLIRNFDKLFDLVAELEWKKYRMNNNTYLIRLFHNIFIILESYSDFEEVLPYMSNVIEKMYEIVPELIEDFITSLKNYHEIFHNPNIIDKNKSRLQYNNQIREYINTFHVKNKEYFKKSELNNYKDIIKLFYKIKSDSPAINKSIFEVKQKQLFKSLYNTRNIDVLNLIEDIIKKYNNIIPEDKIRNIIYRYIIEDKNDLNCIFNEPERFQEYLLFERIRKLINRLNNNYITINNNDVKKYKDFINFNGTKYCYNGNTFLLSELKLFEEYLLYENIFKKIIKDIMIETKKLKIDNEIDNSMLQILRNKLPFNDENYEFDLDYILNYLNVETLLEISNLNKIKDRVLDDEESFSNIYNLLISNNLTWFIIIQEIVLDRYDKYNKQYQTANYFVYNGVDKENLINIINSMPEIINNGAKSNINITLLKEIFNVYNMRKYSSDRDIAILSKNVVEKLYRSTEYTNDNETEIIKKAIKLYTEMIKRNSSTVPYINGKYKNYNYSMYDSNDEETLISGINTESCFKISGICNDLLHYTTTNKNGFTIKITDENDKFIAKASGFRNGNSIYMNQLRSIYDRSLINKDVPEEDIKACFTKACEDIINNSHENIKEKLKIDHVFITNSYLYQKEECNISLEAETFIGRKPVNHDSKDWNEWRKNTSNLQEKNLKTFTTDYDTYSPICVASIKKNITKSDIIKKDVPAIYEKKRNEVIYTTEINKNVYNKLNKINAINSYYSNLKYVPLDIPNLANAYLGDNWYIIIKDDEIVSELILSFDQKAIDEYNEIRKNFSNEKKLTLKLK